MINKLFDLDRCFVANEVQTSNDNKLIIVNIHMSAYDEGGIIREKQLNELNLLEKKEMRLSKKMLTAAAMTYVAAVATAILEILRLVLIFTRMNDD